MNLKPDDLPEHIKRINPHLFVGGVEKRFTKRDVAAALDKAIQARPERTGSVVVSLVSYRRKELDSDNLVGGLKPLRDAIANSIGIDDGDKRIRFEYGQIVTTGHEGTMVKIEAKETI